MRVQEGARQQQFSESPMTALSDDNGYSWTRQQVNVFIDSLKKLD
jgi:hypothetical protein